MIHEEEQKGRKNNPLLIKLVSEKRTLRYKNEVKVISNKTFPLHPFVLYITLRFGVVFITNTIITSYLEEPNRGDGW